jgi:predicted lipoprotein with Yx(FWY)xxD motif
MLKPAVVTALCAAGLAACGGSDTREASSTATATPTATPTAAPATLRVRRSRLGPILVDAGGRTLYLYTQDDADQSLCTSDVLNCPTSWPPLTTTGPPRGDGGVKAGLLGSIARTKPAGTQVTYSHHPLYTYAEDTRPGDLKGQGYFDRWYVLSPTGRPITKQ